MGQRRISYIRIPSRENQMTQHEPAGRGLSRRKNNRQKNAGAIGIIGEREYQPSQNQARPKWTAISAVFSICVCSKKGREVSGPVDEAGKNNFVASNFVKNQVVAITGDRKGPIAESAPKPSLMSQKWLLSQQFDCAFDRIKETVGGDGLRTNR